MKTMKRILSGILGISMLAGLWTAPVYAQSEVDFFATFENYEGTGIPEGFSMWNYANGSTYASRNQAGNYGGEEASKGVHILTDSVLVYNFDSVMKTGKLNISFDLKSDDLTNSTAILLGGYDQAAAGTTDNPYDWTKEGESTSSDYSRLFDGQFRSATIEGTKLGVYTDAHGVSSCKEYSSSIALTEGFHKYEYEFDLDNSRYTAYVDGTKFADNLGLVKGVKAFIIRNEGSAAPSLWVDNFCVYTGTKNLKMAAETANVAQVNGKVNVGVSQVSDLSGFTADTFTAKHKVTGDSVKPTSVAVHKNGLTLTFASLSAGDYELSNSLIDNKTYFSVVSGVEAAEADAKYTYLDDSLNVAAEGTLPTGWVAHSGAGTNIAADAEGGMKSAKGTRQDMRYVFPEIIHSGRTVFEFDVKAEQGANPNWGIGLIRQEQLELLGIDLPGKINSTYDNNASLQDTWTRKIMNILVGSNATGKIYFNNEMGIDGKVTNSAEYEVADDGKYHNVKFVLDMDAAAYEISIDGNTAVKQNYTGNIFGWKSVSWADGTFDWYQGIVGLRLLVNDTSASDVSFKNIKVYRESSDNDNHILTNLGGSDSDQLRTVWFAPQLTYHAAYKDHSIFGPFYTMGVESAPNFTFMNSTGNTGSQKYDAANYPRSVFAFNGADGLNVVANIYQRNTVVHHYFDVPVKAGKAFTVEFDIKEDKCSASIWNINLLDENDMIARPDNWTGTKTPYGETANATDGNYWYQNVVLSNWGWNYGDVTNPGGNGIWLGDGTKREAQSRATYWNEDDDTYPQIPWTDATWHNVKLHIVPGEYEMNGSKYYTKYEITVTVGEDVYSTTQYFTTDRFSATDTYGMALWQRMINDDNTNRGTTYMKNLRVYEDPAVDTKLAAVASVTAVSADGTENTVNTSNSVIPSDTTEVRVNMTEALAENVSAYITLGNIAGTVSADGKSYVFDTEGKLSANAALTLNVSDKTPFDENSTVLNEAFSLDMTVADDADTKAFEFTLKEKIVPNNIFLGYTAPEYWNDTTIYFGNEKEKKLVLEGYNSDEATTIAIMTAVYSTDEQGAETLEDVTYETISVPTGSFSKELTEFASAETADKLKAYAWLYPSMKPIAVNIG